MIAHTSIEDLRERAEVCITQLADIEAHLIGYHEGNDAFRYARDLASAAADAAQSLEDELFELSKQEEAAFEPLVKPSRSVFSLAAQLSAQQIDNDSLDEAREVESEMKRRGYVK